MHHDAAASEQVRRVLIKMAAGFGGAARAGPLDLRWGPLFARLAGWDQAYVQGLELIYEGYLLHYRESRVLQPSPGDRETCLLAGDVFYAQGLRQIAGRGDVDAVALLTRLMASCACLRSVSAPFEVDDALWAWTTGGLAGLTGRGRLHDMTQVFDETDARLAAGEPVDVGALVSDGLSLLGLADPGPVLQALESLGSHAAMPPTDDLPLDRS